MKREPKLALCMIARDEEAAIGAALAAARPYCDEMVVVDTGSADRTREVAAKAGARVVEIPWTDDFAAARNRSLDETTAEFALVLDADETLTPECGRQIRAAIRRPDTAGVFLPVVNRFEGGREIPSLILRVFLRRKDVRFRNRIHEQVLGDLNVVAARERRKLVRIDGVVHHDGYRAEVIERRGKNERNRRIFELALADAPDDLYLRYKFADFLRRYDDAPTRAKMTALLEAGVRDVRALPRERRDELPFAAEFYALLAQAARDAGSAGRAAEIADAGVEDVDPTVNLRFIRAAIALDAGDAAGAADGFRACLAEAGRALIVPGQPGVVGVASELGLAQAALALGRADEARAACERAAEAAPERDDVLDLWLRCAARGGDPGSAIKFLTKRLAARPADAAAWEKGGELLAAVAMPADAARWFVRAAATAADPARPLARAAECLLHARDLDGALEAAAKAPAEPRAQAVIAAVSACAGVEMPPCVEADRAETRAAFRALVAGLADGEGRPVAAALAKEHDAASIFDPALAGLLADAFG